MGALFTAFAGFLWSAFSVLFGSWKTVIGGLFLKVILVVVLYNLVVEIAEEVMQFALDTAGSVSVPSGAVQNFDLGSVTQLGAYFCNKLRVGEIVSWMVTCVLLRWTLKKIPFLRW